MIHWTAHWMVAGGNRTSGLVATFLIFMKKIMIWTFDGYQKCVIHFDFQEIIKVILIPSLTHMKASEGEHYVENSINRDSSELKFSYGIFSDTNWWMKKTVRQKLRTEPTSRRCCILFKFIVCYLGPKNGVVFWDV